MKIRSKHGTLVYAVAAFLLPLSIRLIPEVIAWPYPLGFDTVFFYVPSMMQGHPLDLPLQELIKGAMLLPAIAGLLNQYLVRDPVLIFKILGPVLYGFLGLSMYALATSGLKWTHPKALVLVYLASIYFISLRISWEMYRQMLGTIFLLLGLTSYTALSGRARYAALALLAVLTVLSHEIPTVVLFASLGVDIVLRMLRSDHAGRRLVDLAVLLPAGVLCIFWFYRPAEGPVPFENLSGYAVSLTFSHVFGFLLYSFGFLIPLAAYGAFKERSRLLGAFIGVPLALAIWPIVLPSVSPNFWFRWAMMMVYPIMIYFTAGLQALFKVRGRNHLNVVAKAIVVLIVLLMSISSAYYLVATPQNAHPYFSNLNPYKEYVQSSMLQNSLPITDVSPTLHALQWIQTHASGKSALVLHEAFYAWAVLEGIDRNRFNIVVVREACLSCPDRESALDRMSDESSRLANSGCDVYTIWWVNGQGWYNIPSLPSAFKPIQNWDNIAVYLYQGSQ